MTKQESKKTILSLLGRLGPATVNDLVLESIRESGLNQEPYLAFSSTRTYMKELVANGRVWVLEERAKRVGGNIYGLSRTIKERLRRFIFNS